MVAGNISTISGKYTFVTTVAQEPTHDFKTKIWLATSYHTIPNILIIFNILCIPVHKVSNIQVMDYMFF